MPRNENYIRVIQGILYVSELISSDAKKRRYDRSFPRAVHVPRYASPWPAYFYGVPPSSNSRHSATERNYHIGARVQAGKRTLFVLRLDLLRPFFQPIAPRAFNPLSELRSLNRSRF